MKIASVSIAQAKNNLPHLIHEVEAGKQVQVTRHGRPAAVLVSVEMFAAMQETRKGFAVDLQRFRKRHRAHLLSPDESVLLEPNRSTADARTVTL